MQKKKVFALIVVSIMALALIIPMMAFAAPGPQTGAQPMSGAIWTTDSLGDPVNQNIYEGNRDVYLNGGPKSSSSPGLPDGSYYVKVTSPNGVVLGISNPNQTVQVIDGRFAETYQLWAIVHRPENVDFWGYNETPNPGHEYKVWISQDPEFANCASKTDNFKVRSWSKCPPTTCPPCEPPAQECPPVQCPEQECPPCEPPAQECPPIQCPGRECPSCEPPAQECPPIQCPERECPPCEPPAQECPPCERQCEGLTPGYWKNHVSEWECCSIDKNTKLGDVFTVFFDECDDSDILELSDCTLLEALKFGGGPNLEGMARNMFRHAVAALLNSCSSEISYPYIKDEVVFYVNHVNSNSRSNLGMEDLKDIFEASNELGVHS